MSIKRMIIAHLGSLAVIVSKFVDTIAVVIEKPFDAVVYALDKLFTFVVLASTSITDFAVLTIARIIAASNAAYERSSSAFVERSMQHDAYKNGSFNEPSLTGLRV